MKGDLERGHKPASNGVCPHVSSPWDGRTMGGPIWGILLLAICRVPFFRLEDKWLEATSRVRMRHVFGPKSHVSQAPLVGLLLAIAMEIWDRACVPFRPISAVFATLGQVANTISLWGKGPSLE